MLNQSQEQVQKQQVAQQVQQPMPQQEAQLCSTVFSDCPIYPISLTDIGNFNGAPEQVHECGSTFHGAKFMKVKHMYSPKYERLVSEIMPVPWIAEPQEDTFLNRIKAANEPKVETYRTLHLESIPDNNYGSFQTEHFQEGFGAGGYDLFFKILLLICLFAFIYYVSKNMK